jgi:hypothetical protein
MSNRRLKSVRATRAAREERSATQPDLLEGTDFDPAAIRKRVAEERAAEDPEPARAPRAARGPR